MDTAWRTERRALVPVWCSGAQWSINNEGGEVWVFLAFGAFCFAGGFLEVGSRICISTVSLNRYRLAPQSFNSNQKTLGWDLEIVEGSKYEIKGKGVPKAKGFIVHQRRWVAERTLTSGKLPGWVYIEGSVKTTKNGLFSRKPGSMFL